MSSSNPGKPDSQPPIAPSEDALSFPDGVEPTDDTPTIISKNRPASPEPSTAFSAENLIGSLRGRKLAHFELIEPIGVGGMAAVLRARDTQLDRFVALKILPPDMASDPENIRRFHQEARAAAKLDHENIARVFFCGDDQKLHFIAFEYVEGENLRTLLERRGRLPVGEAIRYTLQVAAGLEHAAARGIVHRDVKPSNIIITPSGRAKLVDMGLARTMERREHDLTQSGVTLGTFDYISPEQAVEPRDADTRSDIYSLGCTLYHMLTGRPPVPEGAAGKKLYYHQNIAPQDPRQLNPDIPDDVAYILSKMMAKDPANRYQRPLQLVQHLVRVAQKVGAADDVPEGVLFVDAPLLAPPRQRPLLIMGIAGAALVVILLILSLMPPETKKPTPVPSVPQPTETVADKTPSPPPAPAPAPAPVPAEEKGIVTNVRELQELLGSKNNQLVAQLGAKSKIDLGSKGLLFRGAGRRLELESQSPDPSDWATLAFDAPRSGTTAGLMLDGGDVTFRRLRIELTARTTPQQAVAAIAITGSGQVTFEDCTFVQTDMPAVTYSDVPPKYPLPASVLVEASADAVPIVTLTRCLFDSARASVPREPAEDRQGAPVSGGLVAIAVNGPADLGVSDCAFRPHDAFFYFRGRCQPKKTQVKLEHCSAFVVNGPAFVFDRQASCRLEVKHSLFSRPEERRRDYWEPDLIRQADDSTPLVYEGEANCYHFLNNLWARANTKLVADYEEFQQKLADQQNGSRDDASQPLQERSPGPWQSRAPLTASAQKAFQVWKTYEEYGVRSGVWGKMTPLYETEDPSLPANYKVVDEGGRGGRNNVFKNLTAALASAVTGDVILLKQAPGRRELKIAPTTLDPRVKSVTLRPYKDHRPILTLDQSIRKKDEALFYLPEGTLTLEGLHLMLEPEREGFTGRSIVQLGDGAHCIFKDCVLTLKPPRSSTRKLPLHVATFDDPDHVMKMGPFGAGRAMLEMKNCFVRGDGDLLDMTGCREIDVSLENCLVGLTGHLVSLQAIDKEGTADAVVQVALKNVSAFLHEPVLSLRGSPAGKNLGHVSVRPAHCLFVSLAERPLVVLETPEAMGEEGVKKYLDWKGDKNFYANFTKLFEHQQRSGVSDFNMSMLDPRWKELFPEPDSRHENLKFMALGDGARALWDTKLEQFRPADTEDPAFPYGATPELGALLVPAPEE